MINWNPQSNLSKGSKDFDYVELTQKEINENLGVMSSETTI